MIIKVLSIFPELIGSYFCYGVLAKALEKKLWELHLVDLKNFGFGRHRQLDDSLAGGGSGMLMRVDVLDSALNHVVNNFGPFDEQNLLVYFSPAGTVFTQSLALAYSNLKSLTLICGRYEGVDARIFKLWPIIEVSLGDFILTGGEIPALALIDSLLRHREGVLGNSFSAKEESFGSSGLLECDQYTRPQNFKNLSIPAVLLGGDHAKIQQWRAQNSLQKTIKFRPDLLFKK